MVGVWCSRESSVLALFGRRKVGDGIEEKQKSEEPGQGSQTIMFCFFIKTGMFGRDDDDDNQSGGLCGMRRTNEGSDDVTCSSRNQLGMVDLTLGWRWGSFGQPGTRSSCEVDQALIFQIHPHPCTPGGLQSPNRRLGKTGTPGGNQKKRRRSMRPDTRRRGHQDG